jgi:DEAD/DEAH box helicase domain-containing protein
MESAELLDRLRRQPFFRDQIVTVREIPARTAEHGDLPIDPVVAGALRAVGVDRLYTHQAQAITLVREGRDVVVVTGTASGKTLCYAVPVMEALARDPLATAISLYPTKALAQDQQKGLGALQATVDRAHPLARMLMGTYDGDTPQAHRRSLRDRGSVILTNPDMLHQGILPNHARWNRLFSNLRYVVIDEIHAYRGVFGSGLANVMRRLARVCAHYGSSPVFICCSATIANPGEHASRIVGREVAVVDRDGSPRGLRRFVYWNPPPLGGARGPSGPGGDRHSPLGEAVNLMSAFVLEGVQTIAFVRTRLMAELLAKGCRERLAPISRKLEDSVRAYRGGYLPEERREIERRLVARELLGVASTNALELGIDIGTLDASILVGYPGSIASLWQQAGRAGRRSDDALVLLVGQSSPIDQYLMMNPAYLFERNPEQAVVDPDNPHIAAGHLQCAVHELRMPEAEGPIFGEYADVLFELLEEEGSIRKLDGNWYWARTEFPAAAVSLRNATGVVYTIQEDLPDDGGGRPRVIGTLDEPSAYAQLHDHAVYLHAAETYFVNSLDVEQKIAHVERRELDYYTQSVQTAQITLDEREVERSWRACALGFGEVTVSTTIPMFKKVRFSSRESLGFENLNLPAQTLETVAFWLVPPPRTHARLAERGLVLGEGLVGLANLFVEVIPFFVMCDTQDVGAVTDSRCLGAEALFVFDRYPGGVGYARRCLDRAPEILEAAHKIVEGCACETGCPSCVGAATPAFATDIDSGVRDRVPGKAAAALILGGILRG